MRMTTIQVASAIVAVTIVQFVFVDSAEAQRRRGSNNTMSSLLGMEEVQKELKLDDEAAKKATEMAEEFQTEMRSQMRELFQSGDRESAMEKMNELVKEFAEKEKEPIAELLDDAQMKRLKQLLIQRQGIGILVQNKDFAAKMGLSEEQIGKIGDKFREMNAEMREKMQELRDGGDRESIQAAVAESGPKIKKALLSMLTDDQRKKFEEAQGAEFKFPQERRRGGGRRGGGGN